MILLIFIISLVINAFFASEFKRIAEQKGCEDSGKYFWYVFLFSIVGMLMVIALPDRNPKYHTVINTPVNQNVERSNPKMISDELPDL